MAFKSNDKTFEKVYGIFDKRDYFNAKGLAKVKIGNFERALQKNDKGAQQILDKFKGDMDKAKDYIIQVITDRKKEESFNDYKAFKAAVDSIQKGKPIIGAVDLVKRRIHNSSQKYTIALYSALRNKKFTKWKDVHDDVDSLIGESVNEGKAFVVMYKVKKDLPNRNVKPSSAAYSKEADAKKFLKSIEKDGGKGMIVKSNVRGMKEGKKRFKRQDGIGKAKYTISFHDGKKKHKDGSDFFDIKIFKNKKDLSDFVGTLVKQGYKLTNESVNEGKDDFVARHGKTNIFLKKGYKHHNETDLENLYDKLGKVIKGLKVKDINVVFESVNEEKVYIDFLNKKKGFKRDRIKFNSYEAAVKWAKKNFEKFNPDMIHYESVNEAKFGYKDSTASYINNHKDEYKAAEKMNKGNEKKFYDDLGKLEDKIGHPKFMLFISNALRGYKVDMYKDPKIKNPQDAQEALFLLSK